MLSGFDCSLKNTPLLRLIPTPHSRLCGNSDGFMQPLNFLLARASLLMSMYALDSTLG